MWLASWQGVADFIALEIYSIGIQVLPMLCSHYSKLMLKYLHIYCAMFRWASKKLVLYVRKEKSMPLILCQLLIPISTDRLRHVLTDIVQTDISTNSIRCWIFLSNMEGRYNRAFCQAANLCKGRIFSLSEKFLFHF